MSEGVTLNVLLGAHGDLCAMLPFLKMEADRIGRPAPLFVAQEYAPLLEGVSYVAPVVFPGSWRNLGTALKYLKDTLPELPVRVLQFYNSGRDAAMRSFLDEMWYSAGAWKGWESRPLVFDRRNINREMELLESVVGSDPRPVILVALKGSRYSIPFKDAKEVMQRIRKEFGKQCRIVNLARVKAERPFDLFSLYTRAKALVTVDTMHLHFSRAVPGLPVFALVRDEPSPWHGTPWQARFAMHVRYREVLKRWEEIRVRLWDAVWGRIAIQDLQHEEPELPIGQYNSSLFTFKGRKMVARRHRGKSWRTDLMLDGKPVLLPAEFANFSHEDMRVFSTGYGAILASFTLATSTKRHRPRCVQACGELRDEGTNGWSLGSIVIPKYGQNDWRGMEKNWVFFVHRQRIFAIYACAPLHVVIEIEPTGKVINEWRTRGKGWAWGQIRGGTRPMAYGQGKWVRFFHSRTDDQRKGIRIPWRYHVGALVMQSEPPFRVLEVSSAPIWSGDERPAPGVWHWKPNVVIPYGALHYIPRASSDMEHWEVSLGINDAYSVVRRVTREEMRLNEEN